MWKGKQEAIKLIDNWFNSDLDFQFVLTKNRKKLLFTIESNAWYEHINNETGITVKSIRHGGDKRRVICVEGDDELYEEVDESIFYEEYDKQELIELLTNLSKDFNIRFL